MYSVSMQLTDKLAIYNELLAECENPVVPDRYQVRRQITDAIDVHLWLSAKIDAAQRELARKSTRGSAAPTP